jgi:hypothetical protein|tara:strand:+ start:202 stop:474 length:273 start_codon:yes stop_codon:yes gene_type:complete
MAFRQRNESMRDLHVALKFIQNKLNKDEQIIITKEGFDIMLVESKNILEPMDAENTEDVINGLVEDADVNPVPRHIYGVDVEMHRHMYGQ